MFRYIYESISLNIIIKKRIRMAGKNSDVFESKKNWAQRRSNEKEIGKGRPEILIEHCRSETWMPK